LLTFNATSAAKLTPIILPSLSTSLTAGTKHNTGKKKSVWGWLIQTLYETHTQKQFCTTKFECHTCYWFLARHKRTQRTSKLRTALLFCRTPYYKQVNLTGCVGSNLNGLALKTVEYGGPPLIPRTDRVIETEIDWAARPRLCGHNSAHPVSGEVHNVSRSMVLLIY